MGERLFLGVRGYGLIVAMWVRATLAYRTSFALMALGSFVSTFLNFVAIMIMFTHTDVLGGFTVAEVALLYGTSATSLGLADLLLGSLDRLGARVRDGTMDALLVRPVPVFAQVTADRFALRRLGRITQGVLVLGWSLTQVEVDWTWWKLVLLPVTVLSGLGIYGAIYTCGAAFQFWANDASEVQNAFTYGGDTMLQYPPTIFAKDLVWGATFIIPLAFVNWLPVGRILGRDDRLGLPGWVDFASPGVAVIACAIAGLAWRAGLRGYRSTGS